MSAPYQVELQQRAGYVNEAGYTGGPPPQGQGYPVQPSYGPQGGGQYQWGRQLGCDEYVDRHGNIQRKHRGVSLAICLALCWCITWPCHGPCCGGL